MADSEPKDAFPRTTSIQLTYDIDDFVYYAAVHNNLPFVNNVCVRNISGEDIDDLDLVLSLSDGFSNEARLHLDKLRPGEEHVCQDKDIEIILNASKLLNLTERVACQLKIQAFQGTRLLACETKRIVLLTFDEWPGLRYSPEVLSSFVTPNHPVIAKLAHKASEVLQTRTGSPSLTGYQSRDRDLIKNMAAAAFTAIQMENISYAEPPSSFEKQGQRIRLPDVVLDQRFGTCMDLTLLYAACLEFMGLNPLLVLVNGHIFAGVWLVERIYPEMTMDDPSLLEKQTSYGISEILLVECTAMCAGKAFRFDEAVEAALQRVSDHDNFNFVIDVKRARLRNFIPLPYRIKTNDGYAVQPSKRDDVDLSSPESLGVIIEAPTPSENNSFSKRDEWERKLLDLSLRNSLINLRFNSSIIPLISSDLSEFEDLIAAGKEFHILQIPDGLTTPPKNKLVDWQKSVGDKISALIKEETRLGKLHSSYSEKELKTSLTKLYRTAKSAAEENGVSSLFLALGLLKWYEGENDGESKKGIDPYYAPVVMIPVDLKRKSAISGYSMQIREDDAVVNATLLEFLKQNYDISIDGLDPLPLDDSGLDIKKIFTYIRRAIMFKKGWDITEVCCLGNFTFSQFVMWREIHNGEDFLKNCNVVKSLMTQEALHNDSPSSEVDKNNAFIAISLDDSQLHAVKLAASNTSFILHGPPGTGKSQTITAMIVNALALGKRVLFVAEKMAALEVVKNRLDDLGFQDFYLELHSNKAGKKETLEQLKRSIQSNVINNSTNYSERNQEYQKLLQYLDRYRKAIHHVVQPFGKSVRQIIDLYESIPDHDKIVRFDDSFIVSLSVDELRKRENLLNEYLKFTENFNAAKLLPLETIGKEQYTQRMKYDVKPSAENYLEKLESFKSALNSFVETCNLTLPKTIEEIQKTFKFARNVIESQQIPEFIRSTINLDKELDVPETYLKKQDEFHMREAALCSQWKDEFLVDDMGRFKEQYEVAATKKFFFKTWALKKLSKKIQVYVKEGSNFKIEFDKIPDLLKDVSLFQESKKRYETAQETLPYEWKSFLENYSSLDSFKEFKEKVQKWGKERGNVERYNAIMKPDRRKESLEKAKLFISNLQSLTNAQKNINEILALRSGSHEKDWIESRISICKILIDNPSVLKKWFDYHELLNRCVGTGLKPICDAYQNGIKREEVIDVFLRSVYQQLAVNAIDNEPFLNRFSGVKFSTQIEQFKKFDQQFMEISRKEALNKLFEKREKALNSSANAADEFRLLKRMVTKSGRGLSIRTLLASIPEILPSICPCMLMSPLSVAQYLETKNDMFDLVIFDEASQIPTCKAVGTLARAKNAVIAGDPLQMPPTNFFAVSNGDEEESIFLTEDLKSVLDDCLALEMPETQLKQHYRSRHESLIAFSNKEFYEPEGKEMRTFPSVNDREKRVHLVKVDGVFERGSKRINREEAKKIVAEIKRRFTTPNLSKQSIGVVTFNMPQQELIEDMLQEEYRNNPQFDAWANDGQGAVFVKNLENVQGDERDVILFSVAFGPDSEGKLLYNFGPINKDGGWKRLNVAVTRARTEMVVYTSMTYDMIDLKRSKSRGVASLRNFLEYAQKGNLHGEYIETTARKNEGILERICQRLVKEGYQFQRGVGRSSFKIDLAIVNPDKEDEYLLGIILDGEIYKQTLNPKDREISQIQTLKGLGWRLHRIWTMDWWEDSEKELDKLVAILKELRPKTIANHPNQS